jgi:hypothetical protein
MSYRIQTRDHNGKWKDLRLAGPPHSHIETARAAAAMLDQDGDLTNIRIVDEAGWTVSPR